MFFFFICKESRRAQGKLSEAQASLALPRNPQTQASAPRQSHYVIVEWVQRYNCHSQRPNIGANGELL
jgi:hypothetical protein